MPITTLAAVTEQPDHTSLGKDHFETLDGLRGSAAILIVIFHIVSMATAIDSPLNLLHHAYLAVDFFFGLSGFVIAYAYDDRRQTLSIRQFLLIRVIRLHPLVILAALLGLASYVCDPFAGRLQRVSLVDLSLALVAALLIVPSQALPNRWTDTHSLNGPAWSLFQEYIGNIAYVLILRHLRTRTLAFCVAFFGAALVVVAFGQDTLDRGWGWDNLAMGTVRMAFSFTLGLWLFRVRTSLPKACLSWLSLSVLLLLAILVPDLPRMGGVRVNGLFDAALVIFLFPIIILAGSNSRPGGRMLKACKLAGRLSYSLYITHYPALYIFLNYVTQAKPTGQATFLLGILLLILLLLCAWLFVKFWDEPVRKALRRRVDPEPNETRG